MEKDTMFPAEGVNADQNLYIDKFKRQIERTWEELQQIVQHVTDSMDFYQILRDVGFDNGIIGDFNVYRFLDKKSKDRLMHINFFLLSYISDLREGLIDNRAKLAIYIACKAYLAIGFRNGIKTEEQKDLSKFREEEIHANSISEVIYKSIEYIIEFSKNYENSNDFYKGVQDAIGNFNLEDLESEDLENYNFSRKFLSRSLKSSSNHEGALDPKTMGSVLLAIQMLLTIGFKAGQKYAQSQALARTGPTVGW
jgi:hypothetical protein